MKAYLAAWIAACAAAAMLAVRERVDRDYFRLLAQPWKLISFAVAAVGLTWMAPYSGDPTWDYTDAPFMSV